MGLYRIWLKARGTGRHAIGRHYPARPEYHVDIEARDLKHAKEKANRTPLWTGEITTLRAGDAARSLGRATREDAAWWATAPKDRRSDPPAVRIRGRWYVLSEMTAEQVRDYHRYTVNALRRQLRTSSRRMYGNREPLYVFHRPTGRVLNRSKNLAGVRRYAATHIVKRIDLVQLAHGRGELIIEFENNAHFATTFESYEVMRNFVARWRNVRGVPVREHVMSRGASAANRSRRVR